MSNIKLTRDDLLIILIEECGEVIQAATKCLRFGFDRIEPLYGHNGEMLSREVGDLLAIIDVLPLDRGVIEAYRKIKMAKAERAKADLE